MNTRNRKKMKLDVIYNEDCLEGMKRLPDESIDLVFTDPPYLKEYLYCYDYLVNECPRVMKNGASLLTIVGHYAIPVILEKFKNKLNYRWTMCINQFSGNHARMRMGIEVLWKPILWFVKGHYPHGRGFIRDGVKIRDNEGQSKIYHKWQQSLDWARYYIDKLCPDKGIVLDPFIGSGTTAVACKKLGCHYIGFEINPEYCEIARKRASEVQ